MTRRSDPLTAAHLAYLNALRSGGGHAFCADYVGRCADDLRLYTEMADGIAFTAYDANGGVIRHWFVEDGLSEQIGNNGELGQEIGRKY